MTFTGTNMFTNTRRRNFFIRMLTYVMKNKIKTYSSIKTCKKDYLMLLKVVVTKVNKSDLHFTEGH